MDDNPDRDRLFSAAANPELAARATPDLLKIIAFDARPSSDPDGLRGRLTAFCELAGVPGDRATAQAFTLATFAGQELVHYRDDLLPGAVPAGAVILRITRSGPPPVADILAAATELGWHDLSIVDEYRPYTVAGERPPSIVRLGLVSTVAELTKTDFAEHWVLHHGPLVAGLKPLYDEYIQNVCLAPDQPWDGIVEHWFADEATWREHDRRNLEEKPAVIASARSQSEMQQFAATPVATATIA